MPSDAARTKNDTIREIRFAVVSALLANGFGSVYSTFVLMAWSPWRSMLSALTLIAMVSLVWDMEDAPFPFLLAWGASGVLFGVELLKHRAFLTSEDIVVQSGLFRTREKRYPLREVQKVDCSHPLFGRTFGVGDLEILGYGWACSLVAIRDPEGNARRILDLKAAASLAERPANLGRAVHGDAKEP